MRTWMAWMLALAVPMALAGKVYIYKDANGKMVYSDQPPAQGQKAEIKNLAGNVIDTSGLPYDLQKHEIDPADVWAQPGHDRYPAMRSRPHPADVEKAAEKLVAHRTARHAQSAQSLQRRQSIRIRRRQPCGP